jgi:hypothetical protein
MPRKESILKIRISDDLKDEVEKIADAQGESLSVIVREALRRYIENQRSGGAKGQTGPQLQINEARPRDPEAIRKTGFNINYAEEHQKVAEEREEYKSFPDAGTASRGSSSPGDQKPKTA